MHPTNAEPQPDRTSARPSGFHLQKDASYVMPAHFGPAVQGWDGRVAHYGHNTTVTVSFVTDAEAVATLLPKGFAPANPAVISVSFVMCRDVDFMAGGGYNLVAVNASARFDGATHHARGQYALVLWENAFLPVMLGREILGAPKLLAEVPDAWERDGKAGFDVFENGTPLVSAEIGAQRKLAPEEYQAVADRNAGSIWMGWKHIPACDFRGGDLSHATALPFETDIQEAWAAQGSVRFHQAPFTSAPVSHRAATALSRLPQRDTCPAIITRGSKRLLIAEQYAMH